MCREQIEVKEIGTEYRKSMKERKCCHCSHPIRIGQQYIRHVVKVDGEVQVDIYHRDYYACNEEN